jgi:hypothetical protein
MVTGRQRRRGRRSLIPLAIVAAAAAGALLALLTGGRGEDARPGGSAARPSAMAAPGPGPALPAPAAPAAPAALDMSDEPDDAPAVVDRAHAALQAVARRCWEQRQPRRTAPGEPDETTGRLRLRLSLSAAGGEARTGTAEVIEPRQLAPALERCIREAVVAARWPEPSPAAAVAVEELFRMGDYTVPLGPPPPLAVAPAGAPPPPGPPGPGDDA